MLLQRHMSLGAITVSTTCVGLTLVSAGAAELEEFSFNFGLDTGLTYSSREMGCTDGSLRLKEGPGRLSSRGSSMDFNWPALRSHSEAIQTLV